MWTRLRSLEVIIVVDIIPAILYLSFSFLFEFWTLDLLIAGAMAVVNDRIPKGKFI